MRTVFEELGEPSRRLILGELRFGPRSVSEIVSATGLKQPNVSNHLSRLRAKDLVRGNRVGRQIYYVLSSPAVTHAVNLAFVEERTEESSLDLHCLAQDYAAHAVAGEESECLAILEGAMRQGLGLLAIYQDLLTPALHQVGDWYEAGQVDVAQEHFAASLSERLMARVAQTTPPSHIGKSGSGLALLGCVETNTHCLGLRMVADYVRLCSWRTRYLGADVPTTSFVRIQKLWKPKLTLVSISLPSRDQGLQAIAQLSASKAPGQTLVAGGQAVEIEPDRFLEAGADEVALSLKDFADRILPKLDKTS
jgi:MerR family transcriptional regulator, light-induced transcriptional regulator